MQRLITHTSELHILFWPLHGIREFLIRLALVNHEDWRFKCQNRSRNAKVIQVRSDCSLFFSKDHIDIPNCVQLMDIESFLILSTESNLIVTCVFWVFVLKYKPCHVFTTQL